MTNLEFYKDLILKKKLEKPSSLICSICQIKNKKCVCYKNGCPSNKELLNWLCEEQTEPIKLKQWEYDLLFEINTTDFRSVYVLVKLKEKGHFKGITDITMNIKDILDNCEVVYDD